MLFGQDDYGNSALMIKHGLKLRRLVKSFWYNTRDFVPEVLRAKAPLTSPYGVSRYSIFTSLRRRVHDHTRCGF
jgi:hypothetical protein